MGGELSRGDRLSGLEPDAEHRASSSRDQSGCGRADSGVLRYRVFDLTDLDAVATDLTTGNGLALIMDLADDLGYTIS